MEWIGLITAAVTLLGAIVKFLRKRAREREHDSDALVKRDRTVLRDGLERLREK